jgi:hypothetical protein
LRDGISIIVYASLRSSEIFGQQNGEQTCRGRWEVSLLPLQRPSRVFHMMDNGTASLRYPTKPLPLRDVLWGLQIDMAARSTRIHSDAVPSCSLHLRNRGGRDGLVSPFDVPGKRLKSRNNQNWLCEPFEQRGSNLQKHLQTSSGSAC